MAELAPDNWRRASIITEKTNTYWGEDIIGRVITPALIKMPRTRYWFSRYDFGEGEREILLSYQLQTDNVEFEKILVEKAMQFGYTTRFIDFDMKNGPGGIGTTRFTNTVDDTIYEINLDFLQVLSKIVMLNLERVNGDNYIPGVSNSDTNPHGSVFESFHHMFWNITQCPMYVYLHLNNSGALEMHTHWSKRPNKLERQLEIRVQY